MSTIAQPRNINALRVFINDTRDELLNAAQQRCTCADTALEFLLDIFIDTFLHHSGFEGFTAMNEHFFQQVSKPYTPKQLPHQRNLLDALKQSSRATKLHRIKYKEKKIKAVERAVFKARYIDNLTIAQTAYHYNLTRKQVTTCYNHVQQVLVYSVATLFVI